jgi:hypothetical protein
MLHSLIGAFSRPAEPSPGDLLKFGSPFRLGEEGPRLKAAPPTDALDKAHKDLGNPLDHAANAAVGTVVGAATANPARGAATGAALEAKGAANRSKYK